MKYRPYSVMVMLWSQIKLTSYDFSDVHITGKFDNRPGTGQFLRIFSCVVTYRTSAVLCQYMKTSSGARLGTVRCSTVLCQRCKRSARHCTVPGRFYMNFHVQKFSCAMTNTVPGRSHFTLIDPTIRLTVAEEFYVPKLHRTRYNV